MTATSQVENNNYTTKFFRTTKELESIRDVWKCLQQENCEKIPDNDIERFLSVNKALKTNLFALVLYSDSRPITLLMAHKSTMEINLKIGYLSFYKPKLQCLSVAYSGVIGDCSENAMKKIILALQRLLKEGEADILSFNHLLITSDIYKAVRATPSFLCRDYYSKTEPHWQMRIHDSIDDMYKKFSRKHRGNYKRMIKKLEKNYRQEITLTNESHSLKDAIKKASGISISTYQYALGSGFVDDDTTHTLLHDAAKNGWLRLHILTVDNVPCAFQLAFQYGEGYYLQQLGFDPKWKKLNVGTVLFLKVYEELCNDKSVTVLDFGFGDADYKRSFGDKYVLESSLSIFACRLFPIWINVVNSITSGINIMVISVFQKMGVEKFVKRKWRNLLQSMNKK